MNMLKEQIIAIDTELAEMKAKRDELEAKKNQLSDELAKAKKQHAYNSIEKALQECGEWTRQCTASINLNITSHHVDGKYRKTFGCDMYIHGPAEDLPPYSPPASDNHAGIVRFTDMNYTRLKGYFSGDPYCSLRAYSVKPIIDFLNRSNFKKVEITPKLDDVVELFLAVLHSTNIEGDS